MAHITRGVAYPLWQRVQELAGDKGLNASELAERSGVRRQTIDNLKTSTRVPQPRIINALAAAVGLDRREAHILAGRLPAEGPDQEVDVREAIRRSSAYNEAQRRMLLDMVDTIEAANAARERPAAG